MYKLYFDGSMKGDTLGCGAVVIYKGDKRIYQRAVTLLDRPMSCNVAEYNGLILGLEYLIEEGLTQETITVFGDSQLVIKQMFGHWKIKKGLYKSDALMTLHLLKQFSTIHGYWIPREQNEEADKMSKKYPKNYTKMSQEATYAHQKAYEEHQVQFNSIPF